LRVFGPIKLPLLVVTLLAPLTGEEPAVQGRRDSGINTFHISFNQEERNAGEVWRFKLHNYHTAMERVLMQNNGRTLSRGIQRQLELREGE
jgi:hypothetical protein